jgi:hypothetical protein
MYCSKVTAEQCVLCVYDAFFAGVAVYERLITALANVPQL